MASTATAWLDLGKPAHILVPSCFIVELQLRKKIQLLLLGRKHIGFCLEIREPVIKKSLTLTSVAQTPKKRMFLKREKSTISTPTEIELS